MGPRSPLFSCEIMDIELEYPLILMVYSTALPVTDVMQFTALTHHFLSDNEDLNICSIEAIIPLALSRSTPA